MLRWFFVAVVIFWGCDSLLVMKVWHCSCDSCCCCGSFSVVLTLSDCRGSDFVVVKVFFVGDTHGCFCCDYFVVAVIVFCSCLVG